MKKIGLFLAAGLLSLGCVQLSSVSNDHVTLTSKVADAPAVSVRKANTASTEAKYVTSVTTQVEENGSNYNMRFSALVSAKYEDGKYYVPGDYGFHVEFTGSTQTVNTDYNVQYFYNSISATVGGVTTWYANEYSTVQNAESLESIPTIGSEVIGDSEYNVKLVISLTVEGITDATREFTVRPYVDIEGAKSYGDHSKVVTVNDPSGSYPVALDGKMDDHIWSQAVIDDRIEVRKGTTDATDLYVTRDSKGVYIYGEYHVATLCNNGDGWWQKDNFEFRLTTMSDPQPIDTDQIYVSALNGGTHNATDGYVSSIVQNTSTGWYDMSFEIFVAYDDNRVQASEFTPIGLHWGCNPASGWYMCNWWYTNDFDAAYRVSYHDESACVTHNYKEVVISNASCSGDGLKGKTCYVCSHYEEEAIPMGEHDYSEIPSVQTPSTCIAQGTAHVGCTGCDEYEEVSLDLDRNNHSGTYENGAWTCCGDRIQDKHTMSSDPWYLYDLARFDGTASWETKVYFHNSHTAAADGNGHNWVGEITFNGGGWSYRSDWYGWWLNGCTYNNENVWGNYFEASADMDVVLTVAYNATTGIMTVQGEYTSHVAGYERPMKVSYTSVAISNPGTMTLKLGVERATVVIDNFYIVSGTTVA